VVHHGIDSERISPPGTSLDQGLQINTDNFLLFVGKFHGYKDIPNLVRAFSRLDEDVDLVLASAGGEDEDIVHRLIRDNNLGDRIHIVRDVSDEVLNHLYSEALAFVLPSRNEAFGLVLLEAMSAGLPIIFVNEGAAPEVIGDAGISVPQGDIVSMEQAISDVISDKSLRNKLERNAKHRVSQFSWEKAAEQYVQIYSRLL